MLIFARRLLLGFSLLVTSGAAAASAQAPKPVPGRPYQFWDVEDIDGGARRVYFRNDSPTPITITQLLITRCDNTRQNCGTFPAKLVVAPGKTVMAFKLERLDKKLAWSFGYSFRTAGQLTATIGSPQSITTTGAPGGPSTVTMKHTVIDSLAPMIAATTAGGSCVTVNVADLPPGHRALMMAFGTGPRPTARRVMVRLDANGAPYEYTDTRQAFDDSLSTVRQSQVSIDFVRQSVQVIESVGPWPTAAARATGGGLLTAASLGRPGETIARMVKECGGS